MIGSEDKPVIIAPASKPQELFLNLKAYKNGVPEEVDIIFYGGAAAGGKSYASLLHHLKYAHDPLYRGITLRRTTPMLMKPGAIWDEAKSLYKQFEPGCQIKIKDLKFVMESKAEIAFNHFEDARAEANFQGSQLSSVVLDELTHFENSQFDYLLSRLRTKANMKPVARATMNPAPDSWVHKKYVMWYLYPEGHELYGRPDPSKQGVVRWFIRQDNEQIWGESYEEMQERYPGCNPLSFAMIFASVYDNPYVEKSYLAYLEGLPRIQKEILLYGSWSARAEEEGLIKRQWFKEEDKEPPWTEIVKTVRAYDFAGTLKSPDTAYDPDYTACLKISRLKDNTYFIHDIQRIRIRFGDWKTFILDNAIKDGPKVDVVLPIDPNPAAKAATMMLAREITNEGYFVRTMKASGKKVDRFRPFASMCLNGGIRILKYCGTDFENKIYNDLGFFYTELENFTGDRKGGLNGHDDLVDICSDGMTILANKIQIPNFLSGLQSAKLTRVNPLVGIN